MSSSQNEKKNSDVAIGEASPVLPIPAIHEATPTFVADLSEETSFGISYQGVDTMPLRCQDPARLGLGQDLVRELLSTYTTCLDTNRATSKGRLEMLTKILDFLYWALWYPCRM
ncbi:hypothetical protein F2Q68_00005279 [Brassica cretica]|uniref:Uncharacterized protein n=1 Tax=Brassica cretica TaxID=69181 RepID=A0A8S9J783_BRACR|nr:hypothetical protein F2Q68_00005279 [Brassica cretica]